MQNVIITDGRYLNEAKAIKEKDGIVVLIDRPSHRNADQNDSEKIMGEVSDYFGNKDANGIIADSNYPMFDYYIKNDSSISNLEEKIIQQLIPSIVEKFELKGYKY
jgi:hypothetical protein